MNLANPDSDTHTKNHPNHLNHPNLSSDTHAKNHPNHSSDTYLVEVPRTGIGGATNQT